jgi:bacteriorhodopsin
VAEATFYRYHDWAITTPLMLLSTMVYFDYQNKPEEVVTLESFWTEHWKDVLIVFAFNVVMLLFGYLYERNAIGLLASQAVGFAGYAGTFYVIWDKFASKTASNALLYWFMTIVWGFYGVAAFFSPSVKNTAYNLLDVVSKNFYGLFLSYLINKKSI